MLMVSASICCPYQIALAFEHSLIGRGLKPSRVETCIFADRNEIVIVRAFHVQRKG